MDKKAIVYYSKNGTTQETVDRIKRDVKKQFDVFDLNQKCIINLNKYDHIFIGCGIQAFHLPGKVVKFIKNNYEQLKSKKITFFIHGIISESTYHQAIEASIGNMIPKDSYNVFYLGGKLDLNKQNFLVKQMLIAIAKQYKFDPYKANTLDDAKIYEFVNYFDL